MKLSTSLVAVKKIKSTVDRSKFSDNDLNQAAKLILEAEGVINPIVLHRTSLESYEVVDGDFEYYAAARAKEIDPRKGEMIGAFIIEPENEEVIKEQVKVIRKQGSIDDHKPKGENSSQENVKSNTDTKQAAKAEMKQLLHSVNPLTLDTPPASNEAEQIKSLLQQFEKSLQQKLEDINNKIAKTITNSTTNTSSSSENIGIEGLSEKLEKLIEKKLQPMVKQINEMDLKLNKFGYYAMTVAQLKAIVRERKLKGISKMTTKDKLVTGIIEFESSRS